jgi:hypothetical protein
VRPLSRPVLATRQGRQVEALSRSLSGEEVPTDDPFLTLSAASVCSAVRHKQSPDSTASSAWLSLVPEGFVVIRYRCRDHLQGKVAVVYTLDGHLRSPARLHLISAEVMPQSLDQDGGQL